MSDRDDKDDYDEISDDDLAGEEMEDDVVSLEKDDFKIGYFE